MSEPPKDVEYFDQILQHLNQTRGFDFTAYKRTSLMRRVVKRLHAINLATFEEYLDYLQVRPDEFESLFDTVLINVTGFFRDAEVWNYLREEGLPQLLDARSSDAHIRIWSAGCASGQEPYSVLMLLSELLGPDAVRDRVKIYATDIDEQALAEARLAVYTRKQLEEVPSAYVEKYFEPSNGTYTFRREMRRMVIFGRHDLLTDAPISRVDLLLCRNTLMYLNADAQARVLARFFFSMNPAGHILLGRAEMLFSHGAMFAPVDLKRRLFRPVPRQNHRDRMLVLAQAGRELLPTTMDTQNRLREMVFESEETPQLLVDSNGGLVAANAAARQRFGLSARENGRSIGDFNAWPNAAELSGAVMHAGASREPVTVKGIRVGIGTELRVFDVIVRPLKHDNVVVGLSITYEDVTELRSLRSQLQHSRQELETSYEELQSTNEELETTNEELQSTVEELETTNEELQSTNEELETMNEELSSTNEELQTMNDELRSRSTDLNSANAFLESMFASLRSAVIVIDKHFRVQVWSDRSTDLWGLRPEEVNGSQLLNLDIGLPVAELHQPIRDVLNGTADFREIVVQATNRGGKSIRCRIAVSPLRQIDRTTSGVILLMEETPLSAVQG